MLFLQLTNCQLLCFKRNCSAGPLVCQMLKFLQPKSDFKSRKNEAL